MKDKINTYLAVLIVTIFGAMAATTIIKIATNNTIIIIHSDSEASYEELKQSILNNKN